MYYLGFLKEDTRHVVVFKSTIQPKSNDLTYFVKVVGPYITEQEARNDLRSLRSKGYRENPATESRAQYCRERQLDPSRFAKGSFRTITLGKGKKGVIACPKGKYNRGECGVGTRLQTILHPVGSRGCPKGGLELKKRKRNPAKVISHKQAFVLTKKILAYAKKLYRHEQKGMKENPGVNYHQQKFLFYMSQLEKYVIGSKPYIELLAKAYEHLESAEASIREKVG